MSMNSLPPAYYGDWLKAAIVLQPSSSQKRQSLAKLLGLEWHESGQVLGPESGTHDSAPDQLPGPLADQVKQPHTRRLDAELSSVGDLPLLAPESAHPPSVKDWIAQWRLQDVTTLASATSPDERTVGLAPLVPGVQFRSVMATACATERLTPRLDFEKIIARLARVEIIRSLPRRPRRDLAAGVQLMLDRGSGMQPFHADQEALRHSLPRWLGPGYCETWSFRDDPGLGVYSLEPERMGESVSYRLPPPGRPILFVSDACLGPAEYDWRADGNWLMGIAESAGVRNSRVLLLTPLSKESCPRALRRHVVWLTWDRDLTIRKVVNQLI